MKKSLLALLTACLFGGAAMANITVTGNGKIKFVPDMAHVHFNVTTEAPSAGQAWQQNSDAMKKVFQALKDLGIDEKDIKTDNVNVQPKYLHPKDAPPQLLGYTVTHQLTVTVRKLADVGKVLDDAVASGANRLTHISFASSQAEELLQQARAKAVAEARKKAELYADGAGARLGLVLNITEGGYAPPQRYRYEVMEASSHKDSTPIAAGEQEMSVGVTVTYALKEK